MCMSRHSTTAFEAVVGRMWLPRGSAEMVHIEGELVFRGVPREEVFEDLGGAALRVARPGRRVRRTGLYSDSSVWPRRTPIPRHKA